MSKVKTAIFPVGGLGTRFLPATKVMPKEMLPVLDKPLIQYAFEEAKNAGIEKFIFITGRNKNVIANHFDSAYELEKVLEQKRKDEVLDLTTSWVPDPGSIAFIRQQKTMGLGHAVLCAKHYVNEPFAVLLADELFLSKEPAIAQLMQNFDKNTGNYIAVNEVDRSKISSYGCISPSNKGAITNDSDLVKVDHLVEKPAIEDAPSNFAVVGRYVLEPEIFDYLESQEKGVGGEIQLTDAIDRMNKDRKSLYAVNIKGDRYDCGNRKGFLEANMAAALNNESIKGDVLEIMQKLINQYKS